MHEERVIIPGSGTLAQMGIVRPLVNIQQAKQAWDEYQDLCRAILTEDDYQRIGNKQFKKKSAWRKFGTFYGLSDEIVEKRILREVPDDPTSGVVYAEFTVRVTAPNGRSMIGWAACGIHEDRNFSKPDHDIPATAHTRAKNRAISDLIGAGEVSAEEMAGEEGGVDRAAAKVVAGGQLATPAQVKAIYVIARNERTLGEEELEEICRLLYGNRAPVELGKREASEFIDKLKSGAPLAPRTPTAKPVEKKANNADSKATEAPSNTSADPTTEFFNRAKEINYTPKLALSALGVKDFGEWLADDKTVDQAIDMLKTLR